MSRFERMTGDGTAANAAPRAASSAGGAEAAEGGPGPRPDLSARPVRELLDRLEEQAQAERVALRDLLGAGGAASFVPALMVPALLVVSPLSGIPGFSSVCGLTIAAIAGQMLFRRRHLSLPERLTRMRLSGGRLRAALAWLRRGADLLDRYSRRDRLRPLVGNGGRVVPQLACVLAGLMMPLLELVPFSSSTLGLAVVCCSVGLLTRDGAFVLAGVAIMSAAALLPFVLLT